MPKEMFAIIPIIIIIKCGVSKCNYNENVFIASIHNTHNIRKINIVSEIRCYVIRKCRFCRSRLCDFSRANDHWEGRHPGLKICSSLQVYLEVEPSDS